VWYGALMVTVLALATQEVMGLTISFSGKLFTHVCFCHQAVYFVTTDHSAVMPYGWEGNPVIGMALHWSYAQTLLVYPHTWSMALAWLGN